MTTVYVHAPDLLRILPEIVLSVFAILVMVSEPFTSPARKSGLGWLALFGVIVAGAGTFVASLSPGLAFGGSLAADGFSFYFIFIFLLVAALTILGSMRYLDRDNIHHGEYYALILMATVGACFMAASTDLIMIFIGLEISSISTYILAGFRRADSKSNEASLKYFLLGSFATAFFLYGIAFVYGATGTTNLIALGERLTRGDLPAAASFLGVAVLLMFVGLAFKVSTAPFQIWTPDVYQGAPAPVTAFLSTAPKAAAFAVLLRIFVGSMASLSSVSFWVIWLSAILTMSVGNLGALAQSNVKRLLAYSSIAHAGYVLVAIAAALAGAANEANASVIFYLLSYALMNVAAFVLVAHLAGSGERCTNVEDYVGLARERPAVAAAFTLLLLSLGGIPATAGFFAKFYVFRAAIHAHLIGLTVIALLNSVVSVYYYLKLIVAMYMGEGKTEVSLGAVPWPLGAALAVSLAGIVYLGLFPSLALRWALSAAQPLP
ncbi:MAG TPA: NADH-quinone oxidoreductase subunit N [Terriglobia bacterium]|nr:NADH-quinone oxidoreductase subunit N [Terriglobia bacterium]